MQVRLGKLVDLNVAAIYYLADSLGIGNKFVLQSSLQIQSQSSELLVKITKETGADVYLTPLVTEKYVDEIFLPNKGLPSNFLDLFPGFILSYGESLFITFQLSIYCETAEEKAWK